LRRRKQYCAKAKQMRGFDREKGLGMWMGTWSGSRVMLMMWIDMRERKKRKRKEENR
jgi:hypothetical protein